MTTAPPSRTWAILASIGLLSRSAVLMFVAATQVVAASAVPDWEARAEAGDLVGILLALGVGGGVGVSLLTLFFAVLAFLVWLHRAVRRAHSYGIPHPNATPWGAVACWFIPFVNLVRPYTVVKSLYQASHAQTDGAPRDLVARWPKIMPTWWIAWLVGTLLTNIYFRMWSGAHVSADAAWLGVIGASILLLAATCAAVIVWSVQTLQEAVAVQQAPRADTAFREFQPPRV